MSADYYLELQTTKNLRGAGPKAMGLHWLMRHGARVPRSFVCTYQAQPLFEGPADGELAQLKAQITASIDPKKRYAVRSAASLEDGGTVSFAGQFSSTLQVQGYEAVIETVAHTFASRHSPAVQTYMEKIGLAQEALQMSVLIQEMVSPMVSGVAFSRNPISGLDEVVVETISGEGTALLQGGVTPQRWVYKWGDWIEAPEEPELDPQVAAEVVSETQRLAGLYGKPVDLEWVYDGRQVNWVQLRPISGIEQIDIYSNRIAKEVLPGMVKPLVWSVNVPGVNSAWCDLFTELIGPNEIEPETLARAFYYRAYFNMGVIGTVFKELGLPQETLELMMGLEGGQDRPRFRPSNRVWRHTGRMIRFILDKLTFAGRVERELPLLRQAYAEFDIQRLAHLDDAALDGHLGRLMTLYQRTAYLNIVTPLLMLIYDGMWRRQLQRLGLTQEQFNLMHGVKEMERYDPNVHLARLHARYQQLEPSLQQQIAQSSFEAFLRLPGLNKFQVQVGRFAARFGHLSDSGNDFSSVPWRENKRFILQLIANFTEPKGNEQRHTWETLPLNSWQRFLHGFAFRRARQFRLYREAVSAQYTYGYGLFRAYFLEIGKRFANRGWLEQGEDIFYLYLPEIREALASGEPRADCAEQARQRRQQMQAAGDYALPELIYGDRPPPPESFDGARQKLRGVATSRGYYQGVVKVIHSLEAFAELDEGEVLVIPFSDVSWTPLFAKAGAVIAESGGTLSHSSIVAREYQIPAVVSVDGACRIPDGTRVTVDGFKGEVLLHPSVNGGSP